MNTTSHPAGQAPNAGISLNEILRIAYHQRWILLAFGCAAVVAGGLVYQSSPSTYRSEARLLVRYLKPGIDEDSYGEGVQKSTLDRSGASIINSEVEILSSMSLVEDVIDEIGADQLAPDVEPALRRNAAMLQLSRSLLITPLRNSSIIRLEYHAPTSEMAQRVLSSLVDRYLRKHAVVHNTAGEYEFLSQQTDQLRARLLDTEEELRRAKQEAGVVSLAETKLLLSQRLEDIQRSIREATASLEAMRAASDAYNQAAGILSADAQAEAIPLEQKENAGKLTMLLRALRERELTLMASYGPESTLIRNVRDQIAHLTDELAKLGVRFEVSGGGSSAFDTSSKLVETSVEVAALQARLNVLQKYDEETNERLRGIERTESKLVRLQRAWELQEVNYLHYAKSLEQARVEDALTSGRAANISIVEPATRPIFSTKVPTANQNALGTMGAILALGAAVVALRYFLDRSRVRRAEDVQRILGAPSLIVVPRSTGRRRLLKSSGAANRKLLGPQTEASKSEPEQLLPEMDLTLREHLETLWDRLAVRMNGDLPSPCMLGFTSCDLGAGVSSLCEGVGAVLARQGEGRILMVDTAGASGVQSKAVRMEPGAAFMDLLTDQEGKTVVVQPSLYLLTAWEPGEDRSRVGLHNQMRDIIQTLKTSSYRFVLFELPPVSDTSLALRLGRLLDGLVLVLEAGKTTPESARTSARLLRDSGARLLGTVLNKAR